MKKRYEMMAIVAGAGIAAGCAANAADPSDSNPGPTAQIEQPLAKYYYNTWATADGYEWAHGDDLVCGPLFAGRNYFYCQYNSGNSFTFDGYTNVWWLFTDLDNGGQGWVSAVYVTVGGQNEKIPGGLPVCARQYEGRTKTLPSCPATGQ